MPNVPYPYEVNGKLVTGNGSLIPGNKFLIKPFLIAKFDCTTYLAEIPLSSRIANLFSAKTIDYIALGRTLLLWQLYLGEPFSLAPARDSAIVKVPLCYSSFAWFGLLHHKEIGFNQNCFLIWKNL